MRIFYSVNRKDNGRISWREFKQSDLFPALETVDREEDINKVPSLLVAESPPRCGSTSPTSTST